MEMKSISGESLKKLLDAEIKSGVKVFAPVREGQLVNHRPVQSSGEICWDFKNTRLSPKHAVFPRSETIIKGARTDGGVQIEDAEPDAGPAILFAARPCDASSLTALDALFNWDYTDKFYQARRDALCVIGMACVDPAEQCFCAAVGGSPLSEKGSDVLLIPVKSSGYAAKACTDKGAKLMEKHAAMFGPAPADIPSAEEIAGKQLRKKDLTNAKAKLDARFDDPIWEAVARKCVGCGCCAFICPSCHCFDIVDEPIPVERFERKKNWDSCCFGTYTLHASGHNPRPSQERRYRNRVMHKFSYFPERFGILKCSGCGRCGAQCPVNLDIYDVVAEIVES